MHIQGKTFAEAYEKCLVEILSNPDFKTAPRGQKIHEINGLLLEVEQAKYNLFDNEARSVPRKYLANELALYYAGKRNLEPVDGKGLSFGGASKFWNNIANDDKTVNSAYGNLLFLPQANEDISQWDWCIRALVKDRDTRQAIAHMNRPFHCYPENKDFVCTMSYHFFIREGFLDLIVHRRSQDLHFGLTFDAPWEMLLMQSMVSELKDRGVDVEIGSYKCFIGSAHIYERNFATIKEMLLYDFKPVHLDNGGYLPLNKEVIELAETGALRNPPEMDFTKWLMHNI